MVIRDITAHGWMVKNDAQVSILVVAGYSVSITVKAFGSSIAPGLTYTFLGLMANQIYINWHFSFPTKFLLSFSGHRREVDREKLRCPLAGGPYLQTYFDDARQDGDLGKLHAAEYLNPL